MVVMLVVESGNHADVGNDAEYERINVVGRFVSHEAIMGLVQLTSICPIAFPDMPMSNTAHRSPSRFQ